MAAYQAQVTRVDAPGRLWVSSTRVNRGYELQCEAVEAPTPYAVGDRVLIESLGQGPGDEYVVVGRLPAAVGA